MQKVVAALLISLLATPARAFAHHVPINGRDRDVGQATSHSLSPDWLRKAVDRESSRSAGALTGVPLQQRSRLRSWVGRHPVLVVVLFLGGVAMVGAIRTTLNGKASGASVSSGSTSGVSDLKLTRFETRACHTR